MIEPTIISPIIHHRSPLIFDIAGTVLYLLNVVNPGYLAYLFENLAALAHPCFHPRFEAAKRFSIIGQSSGVQRRVEKSELAARAASVHSHIIDSFFCSAVW